MSRRRRREKITRVGRILEWKLRNRNFITKLSSLHNFHSLAPKSFCTWCSVKDENSTYRTQLGNFFLFFRELFSLRSSGSSALARIESSGGRKVNQIISIFNFSFNIYWNNILMFQSSYPEVWWWNFSRVKSRESCSGKFFEVRRESLARVVFE